MADRRRVTAALGLGLVVAAAALGATLTVARDHVFSGVVIDLAGAPIPGATVRIDDHTTISDAGGAFSVRAPDREAWIRADAAGFLARLRPAVEGHRTVLRLTPDDGHTISLVFGGDVMFGRRFFDPNEDGNPSDGQLQPGSTAADYASLLDGVRPVLSAADLAVVNLETPLLATPFIDPMQPRPSNFHPSKEFVFGSSPLAAEALRLSGVDVAGIGNNHLFDGLDDGVRQTLTGLDAAGYAAGSGRTGGGMTEAEAWAPAIVNVRGTTVAIVACTTIDGAETPPLYVAAAAKPGAAPCSADGIRAAVSAARAQAQVVVAMIHGGYEYDRAPTERIRELSAVARAAGATLVVNHHPHVVGGFQSDATGLTAWTIGNLLFDQTVWPTFESYVLTVHIRDGRPIRAMVDPLIIDGFRPKPIVGELALHVARDAAGLAPGSFVVEDGSVEISDPARVTVTRTSQVATGPVGGSILRLNGSTAIDPASASGAIDVGRDLLWTGDFEDEVVDGLRQPSPLWSASDQGRSRLEGAALHGSFGIRLERAGSNTSDVTLAPVHRVPVAAGTRLTFSASMRSSGGSPAVVQLSWFNDLRGESSTQTLVPVPVVDGWQAVRIDVTVPTNAIAVLPIIRLESPAAGRSTLDVDDERLIAWGDVRAATLATDYLRISGAVRFDVLVAGLPGWSQPAGGYVLVTSGPSLATVAPHELPPGPGPAVGDGD